MDSAASLLLRLGLGYVFLWEGIGKVFKGAVPQFMPDLLQKVSAVPFDVPTTVLIVGGIELLLGLLLVLGLFTRVIAICSLVYLLGTIAVVAIFVDYVIVWKDAALACMAAATVILGGSGMSVDAALHHEHE